MHFYENMMQYFALFFRLSSRMQEKCTPAGGTLAAGAGWCAIRKESKKSELTALYSKAVMGYFVIKIPAKNLKNACQHPGSAFIGHSKVCMGKFSENQCHFQQTKWHFVVLNKA